MNPDAPAPTRPLDRPLDRRSFLKVCGLSAVGLAAGRLGLAAGPAAAAGEPFDPVVEKAVELGFDPQAIFRFVADEIRYEPYAGVLRGARGTLESRAGNSADQAVLLAALLSAAAVETRFVQGTLDAAAAAALLESAAIDASTAGAELERTLRGSGPAPEAAGGTLPPDAAAISGQLPDLAERSADLVEERLDRAVDTIVGALQGAGITIDGAATPLPPVEVSGHVWLQAAAGPTWVDLDPSMPGSERGVARATPAGEPTPTLPDGLRHRVELVVTLETLAGSEARQVAVIEHSAFADEMAGRRIMLSHEKPEGLRAIGLTLESALEGSLRYQPILTIGDDALVGVEAVVLPGGRPGVFDTGGDGSPLDGEAVAEWLDVRIVSPDRETIARRTIFDRRGDEARTTGPLDPARLAPVELVDLDAELTGEYLPVRTVHLMALATGATSLDRFRGIDEATDPTDVLWRFPYLYHLGRDALSAAVGLPRGLRAFIDRPNLVAYSLALVPGATLAGQERSTLTVDLLATSMGRAPVAGTAPAAPTGLVAAVVAHEAERLAAGDGVPVEPFAPPEVDSVGAVFEAAEAQGVPLLVLTGPSAAEGLPIAPEVGLRLRADLEEGWVAVIPSRPVELHGRERIGWWLVDPGTGAARDVFEDGRGTAMTEEGYLYGRVATFVRRFVCLGLAVKTAYTLAELILEQYTGFLIGVAVGFPLHYLLGGSCH
jgi:hypothetical protein